MILYVYIELFNIYIYIHTYVSFIHHSSVQLKISSPAWREIRPRVHEEEVRARGQDIAEASGGDGDHPGVLSMLILKEEGRIIIYIYTE